MNRLIASAFIVPGALVLMAAAPPAPTQPAPVDPAKVTMQTTNLGPNVAVIVGSGGNIGASYGPDGVILIDDQFAPLTPKVIAAAAALDPKPVRFIINTHYHFDHTGGNENFGKAGAIIVAQDNVRTRMSKESFIELLNYQFPASPKAALPIITFTDGMTFHFNGDTLHVFHTPPAHTDGDAMIKWENANVLHTGDVFVTSSTPIVDRSAGGTTEGMIAAIDQALTHVDANTKVVPGHGPVADRAAMIAYRDQLKALLERVTAEVKAGKDLDQILALKLEWKSVLRSSPADGLVKSTYQGLTKR